MKNLLLLLAVMLTLWPRQGSAAPIGYSFTVTTAYALENPFLNRIDNAFVEPDTGYLSITNTGNSTFIGTIGTVAISAFAGDLSFSRSGISLTPGMGVSIAIPDDASDVGGFNGPAFFFRPGVEVYLNGIVTNGNASEVVSLLVADADIHSGVVRTDPRGLESDSFVLQGGDPWGFDSGDAFELSQANGTFVFYEAVIEPRGLIILLVPLLALYLGHQRQRVLRHPA